MSETEPLLTTKQVAERLNTTEMAVYKMRHLATFPPAIKLGRHLRWKPEDIEAFIERNKEEQ